MRINKAENQAGRLKRLRLVNFRGFESFRISFADHNYLIGPNNAGKSTILSALRLAETLVRGAYRRDPEIAAVDGERSPRAYLLNLGEFPALSDSIRYEFYDDQETRLELEWRNGARLTAVWPAAGSDDERAFFYLETLKGLQPKTRASVRSAFPPLGVIPVLSPIEHTETLLQEKYIKTNVNTRLASRHFRNNLYLLQQEGTAKQYFEFAKEWTEEIELEKVADHMTDKGLRLDLFYKEPRSRVPKELVWAGDGIQIWLQILFHLCRIRDLDTVILDEPEVYLHPDLQRRLIRVLEDSDKQIVMATHSAEVITETDPADLLLIDKKRRQAARAKTVELEQTIGSVLGTQFNLRLAKALRSKVVVFVEGKDLQILKPVFRTLGLTGLAREKGFSFVDLGGFSMWEHLPAFQWFIEDLLKQSVQTAVLLDRDYRTDDQIAQLEASMVSMGLVPHVWRRKEIESYFVTAEIAGRATKYPVEELSKLFDQVADELETPTFSRLVAEALQAKGGGSQHYAAVTAEVKHQFDENWKLPSYRWKVLPPKQLLSGVNAKLQADGKKAVSIRALANSARRSDLDSELVNSLSAIEHLL